MIVLNFIRLLAREHFLCLALLSLPLEIFRAAGISPPKTCPRAITSPAPRGISWQPSISLWKFFGPPGFEPGTSSTPRKRATRLRYGPFELEIVTAFPAARKLELPPGVRPLGPTPTQSGMPLRGHEKLRCRRDFAPHTPAPALCGIASGLVDLGACAPAQ